MPHGKKYRTIYSYWSPRLLQRLKAILKDHMEWHFKAIDQSLTMTLSAIDGHENWYVLMSPVLRFDEEAANAYGGLMGGLMVCYHVFTALNANTLGVKCICMEGNKVMAVYEFKALDEDTILQSVEEMTQPVINAFCRYIEAIIFVHDQIEGTWSIGNSIWPMKLKLQKSTVP